MPADRYPFWPAPHTRSFGEQLRHMGAVQHIVGAATFNQKPPEDVGDGDIGPFLMTDKPQNHELCS